MGKKGKGLQYTERGMLIGGVLTLVIFSAAYMMFAPEDMVPDEPVIVVSQDKEVVSIDIKSKRLYEPTTNPDICVMHRKSGSSDAYSYTAETGSNDLQYNQGELIDVCIVEDDNSGDGDFACSSVSTGEVTYDYYANCKLKYKVTETGEKDEITIETAREGSAPTYTVLYKNTDVGTSWATGNVSVTNADKTVDVSFEIGSKICFGAPMAHSGLDYSGIITCEGNKSVFENIILKDDGAGTTDTWKTVSEPRQYTSGSGNMTVSYKVPFDVCDGGSTDFDLTIDPDDTTAPGPLETITCTHYDVGFYVDATTGETKYGVEDETGSGNDVGQSTHGSFHVHVD